MRLRRDEGHLYAAKPKRLIQYCNLRVFVSIALHIRHQLMYALGCSLSSSTRRENWTARPVTCGLSPNTDPFMRELDCASTNGSVRRSFQSGSGRQPSNWSSVQEDRITKGGEGIRVGKRRGIVQDIRQRGEEPEQPYPILETRTVMRKIYDDSHTGDYMRSLATTTSGSLIKGWT